MTAKEHLEKKYPLHTRLLKDWTIDLMKSFADLKCKEQHRNTRHQAAELAVKDTELHRDIMNLKQIKP